MRRAITVLLPLVIVLLLALWRGQGPEPKGETAPPGEFSAARAMSVLHANLAEGVPHPMASPENARVRERIERRFRELGYETTLQRRFACNAHAVCGMVENVLARAPRSSGPMVLLVAHYDSVGAGPGASDDGMGVATLLEVARAVRGERFTNAVAFLADDGEEAGLLGAEGFVADEELSRDVGVVINVENRGTYGVSNMFETSRGNRWLIRQLAQSLERPQASSLFYAIYNLLPNDTDVTVFKRKGTAAVNFAAIRGVQWYHTPLDDLAHANPRTLQHHGDNLLGTLRAFAGTDLEARSKTDATYFDVLGFFLVWWPQEWTLWIAVASLLLLVFAARRTPPREMTFGVIAAFAAILFAVLGGAALSWLANSRSQGIHFAATPWPPVAAMWLAGIAAALFAATLFRKRSQPRSMLFGIAIVWHMIGIALALTLGGAAFLFIVPALVLTIAALAGMNEIPMAAMASTAAAIFIFPLGLTLYEALGGGLMVAIAVLIGALATLAAPLFVGARNAIVAAILALACTVIALALPAFTPERPRPINIAYVDDPSAPSPQWIVDTLTAPLRAAAPFGPTDPKLTPWSGRTLWTTPAQRESIPRVTITGERTTEGVRIHVRSPRGAPRLTLRLRGGKVLRVNGVTPPPRPPRFRDNSGAEWSFAMAGGVGEMIVDIAANDRVEAVASDSSFGLSAAGAALSRARAASTAIPIHDGDVTVTRARQTF
jgi:hypothetical protein